MAWPHNQIATFVDNDALPVALVLAKELQIVHLKCCDFVPRLMSVPRFVTLLQFQALSLTQLGAHSSLEIEEVKMTVKRRKHNERATEDKETGQAFESVSSPSVMCHQSQRPGSGKCFE